MPPTPKKQPGEGTQYRFIGSRATILESGQPLAPGDYVTLTEEQIQGQNKMLLDEGALIDASSIPTPEPQGQAEEGSE